VTIKEQIDKWVDGESIHTDICVPDFSCCVKFIKTEKFDKELFRDAWTVHNYDVVNFYLGKFLADVLSGMTGTEVNVINPKAKLN
jgi:hypothetical protein